MLACVPTATHGRHTAPDTCCQAVCMPHSLERECAEVMTDLASVRSLSVQRCLSLTARSWLAGTQEAR